MHPQASSHGIYSGYQGRRPGTPDRRHGGKDLGPGERITPFEALRAITADAAWQNFEEDRKGTLEIGKLADLVVLSDDPLAIDPMKIRDIQILETIKDGQRIYSAKG